MKNTSEQLLSFAENELMKKESIRRSVLREAAQKQKQPIVWTKILLPIAACLVLALGTVFLIPSARAEVLSWFGVSRPADYLTTDPSERPDVPELDSLIASPDANEEVVTIPIDRTDSDAVNSEGALKVSAFLHENCDVELGEAMFDGETLYQTIRLNGLSGLYLLEHWTGSRTMAVPVDPYAVWGLYENGPEEEYLSGEKTLYEMPESWIMYEMPDGTRFSGFIDLTSSIMDHLDHLRELGLLVENQTEEQQQAVDAENRAYLEKNGLMAAAEMFPRDCDYEKYLDADGNLTAKVYYVVKVIEEDRGDGNFVPDTELYNALLGTITVNMKAYQNIEASRVDSTDKVVWGAETTTIHKIDIDFNETNDKLSFIKHRVSMEDVTMTLETENTVVDALGIRNLSVRIRTPESWTTAEREALAYSISFKILLNGESGDWYAQARNCNVQEDGSILWLAGSIDEVPYDLLKSVKSITFVPVLTSAESIVVRHSDSEPDETLNPAYGELVWSKPHLNGWNNEHTRTEYPQYAITLHVN